jgi:L-alanine-DL-glutamate epimerase-like enolase superfamily enzyme
LLGKSRGEPVWKLLGYRESFRKLPYASQLFGDTPEQTHGRAVAARKSNYRAVKFGWGPIGRGDLNTDIDHFWAAREGLGKESLFMIDVGQIFGEDVEAASERLPILERVRALWLEEPFHTSALAQYADLARCSNRVKLAGGEGAHNFYMAAQLIDYANVGYIQVDCGRIGGIGGSSRSDSDVRRGGKPQRGGGRRDLPLPERQSPPRRLVGRPEQPLGHREHQSARRDAVAARQK